MNPSLSLVKSELFPRFPGIFVSLVCKEVCDLSRVSPAIFCLVFIDNGPLHVFITFSGGGKIRKKQRPANNHEV